MSATELLAHSHPNVAGPNSANRNWSDSAGAQQAYNTTSGSRGGNAAMNVMNPYTVLNFIIKT